MKGWCVKRGFRRFCRPDGRNEWFSHEILEAGCGDSDEAAQIVRQVMEALRTLPFSQAARWSG